MVTKMVEIEPFELVTAWEGIMTEEELASEPSAWFPGAVGVLGELCFVFSR